MKNTLIALCAAAACLTAGCGRPQAEPAASGTAGRAERGRVLLDKMSPEEMQQALNDPNTPAPERAMLQNKMRK